MIYAEYTVAFILFATLLYMACDELAYRWHARQRRLQREAAIAEMMEKWMGSDMDRSVIKYFDIEKIRLAAESDDEFSRKMRKMRGEK